MKNYDQLLKEQAAKFTHASLFHKEVVRRQKIQETSAATLKSFGLAALRAFSGGRELITRLQFATTAKYLNPSLNTDPVALSCLARHIVDKVVIDNIETPDNNPRPDTTQIPTTLNADTGQADSMGIATPDYENLPEELRVLLDDHSVPTSSFPRVLR